MIESIDMSVDMKEVYEIDMIEKGKQEKSEKVERRVEREREVKEERYGEIGIDK